MPLLVFSETKINLKKMGYLFYNYIILLICLYYFNNLRTVYIYFSETSSSWSGFAFAVVQEICDRKNASKHSRTGIRSLRGS